MFKCPGCGALIETDDPNDADYVIRGHVVCGRICYDAEAILPVPDDQFMLPLRLDME